MQFRISLGPDMVLDVESYCYLEVTFGVGVSSNAVHLMCPYGQLNAHRLVSLMLATTEEPTFDQWTLRCLGRRDLFCDACHRSCVHLSEQVDHLPELALALHAKVLASG